MKIGKVSIASIIAALLFVVLVGSASARSLSASSQSIRASFSSMEFAGGFGTIRCEVVLESTSHARTTAKTTGSLIGYITAGTVTRCASFGMTIDQGSLPWHRRYAGFQGTLPNIIVQIETFSGAAWRLREPTFGITCQVTGATAAFSYARTTATGAIASATVSGTAPCSGINGTLSGTTTNVDNRAGARITVTLI